MIITAIELPDLEIHCSAIVRTIAYKNIVIYSSSMSYKDIEPARDWNPVRIMKEASESLLSPNLTQRAVDFRKTTPAAVALCTSIAEYLEYPSSLNLRILNLDFQNYTIVETGSRVRVLRTGRVER